MSAELADFSKGIFDRVRLPDSEADRRYTVTAVFCSGFGITLDFGCFMVEMRSGTCARDVVLAILPVGNV